MVRVVGIKIGDDDGRNLVASLIADGSPDALSAAAMIAKGVDRELYAVAISHPERAAILACLEDPPAGPLSELRGKLLRDRR